MPVVLEGPPYSSDLDLCDFLLFLKLKGFIKRNHFEGMEAVKRDVTTELRGIPEESFQTCKDCMHCVSQFWKQNDIYQG